MNQETLRGPRRQPIGSVEDPQVTWGKSYPGYSEPQWNKLCMSLQLNNHMAVHTTFLRNGVR